MLSPQNLTKRVGGSVDSAGFGWTCAADAAGVDDMGVNPSHLTRTIPTA